MKEKKKYIIAKFSVLLLLLFLSVNLLPQFSLNAKAAAVIKSGTCGDNVTYTLDDTGKLTISGTGAMYDYASWRKTPWNTYTKWANDRFYFTSVEVQEGITHVGSCVFQETHATSISLPSTLTSIGESAFAQTDIQKITIPSSVTEIGAEAFSGCTKLESVAMSSRVAVLPERIFFGCYALSDITISSAVTTIDELAFYACKGLTEVTIPANVKVINKQAFDKCENLKKVTILGKTTKLAAKALPACSLYAYPGSYAEEYAGKYLSITFVSLKKTAVRKITITGKTSVQAGKSITLKAKVTPSGASNKTLSWSSSNKKYATVTSKGVVTAKAAGAGKTVKITAKATDGSGVKATWNVTIKAVATKSIKVSPTSCTLTAGDTKQLTVTVNPSNSTQSVTYKSLNKKIAKVSASGKITALKAGKTTITVQSGLSMKKVTVTVKAKKQSTGTSSTSTGKTGTYDGTAAASYAVANAKSLYASGEQCAGFVAKCLINGAGLKMTYKSFVGQLATELKANGFTQYTLTRSANNTIYAKGTAANSKISVGDVIIYYCPTCSKHWKHAVLVTKIDAGTKKVYITDVNINNSYRINGASAADYLDGNGHGNANGGLTYYLYHYEG